jgi:hypothetical protein
MSSSSTPAAVTKTSAGIGRGSFALAALLIYLLNFGSQMLLSTSVTAQTGIVPFVAAQAVLIGLWLVLHVSRLRNAGRPSGTAIGIAAVYALQAVLLALMTFFLGSQDTTSHGPILDLFLLAFLITVFSGNSALNMELWLGGLLVLLLLPVIIAVIFSIWTATRPGQTPAVS